jgi:TorA maturation chaperone TorD
MGENTDHRAVLWGLASLAWVFRGADGGRWSAARQECLPGLASLVLMLESGEGDWIQGLDAAATLEELFPTDARYGPAMQPEELEAEYVRLFINHRGGLAVPLCQSCYQGEGLLMGPAADAMLARLAQAGLTVHESLGLPPDHLAIQIEYLMTLFPEFDSRPDKSGPGDPGLDDSGQAADFAQNVLLAWLDPLIQRLKSAHGHPFFLLCAVVLAAALRCLAHVEQRGDVARGVFRGLEPLTGTRERRAKGKKN